MQYITYKLHWRANPNGGPQLGDPPWELVQNAGCTWCPGHAPHTDGRMLGYVLTGNADDIESVPGATLFSVVKENQALAYARSAHISQGGSAAEAAALYIDTDGRIKGYPEDDIP